MTMSLLSWYKRLLASTNITEAISLLLEAVCTTAQAQGAVLFFFDHTQTELKPAGNYPASVNVPSSSSVLYSSAELTDPLCYCIQADSPCSVEADTTAKTATARCMENAFPLQLQSYTAIPLVAPQHSTLGGIVLGFSSTVQPATEAASLLAHYGASVLSSFLHRTTHAHIVDQLTREIKELEQKDPSAELAALGIIGKSEPFKAVLTLVKKAAPSTITILLTGETGTGKELIASAIHAASPRNKKPFMKINCAAIPSALLESELFGHAKGSFTSATEKHIGIFRSAEGGTILLDEIGDMPLDIQAKLLRFLQDKQVRPVGSTISYQVDLRIIAATNCDLNKAVEEGTFRRDLYHRIAVFPINIPPLRERQEDIPLLADHFLSTFSKKYSTPLPRLSLEQVQHLQAGQYPGNVRELSAILERSIVLWNGTSAFSVADFSSSDETPVLSLPVSMAKYEKSLIASALSHCQGNIKQAALSLGIPRRTLAHKLQNYGMSPNSSAVKRQKQTACLHGASHGINA